MVSIVLQFLFLYLKNNLKMIESSKQQVRKIETIKLRLQKKQQTWIVQSKNNIDYKNKNYLQRM